MKFNEFMKTDAYRDGQIYIKAVTELYELLRVDALLLSNFKTTP